MSAISKDFLVKHGLVVSTTASILSTSSSISTSTGALQVAGGVGIGGDLYVGNSINVSNVSLGTGTQFIVGINEDPAETTYTPTTTGTVTFSDGTIQGTRAPVLWTNAMFISVASFYGRDPGEIFAPTIYGGFVQIGDTYFDDGSFGGEANHLYIMVDQGLGVLQFFDLTPPIGG
jgi:hypothetical protein